MPRAVISLFPFSPPKKKISFITYVQSTVINSRNTTFLAIRLFAKQIKHI